MIEEQDLDAILDGEYEMLPLPEEWKVEPHINVVRVIRQSRESR